MYALANAISLFLAVFITFFLIYNLIELLGRSKKEILEENEMYRKMLSSSKLKIYEDFKKEVKEKDAVIYELKNEISFLKKQLKKVVSKND